MNPASNIILIGPMGAGKTTVGNQLAEHFGLLFVDIDHEIESHAGAAIPLIFELEGEAGFRAREKSALVEITSRKNQVIATGGGAVLDADNRMLIQSNGFVVYLQTSVEQQLFRLRRDTRRPLLQAPDREQKLTAMAQLRNPLYESCAELCLAEAKTSVRAASQRAIHEVAQHWQRIFREIKP